MTKNNKGFTIIEISIALAIIMIITIPVFNLILNSTKISTKIVHNNTLFENARKSIDFISNSIAYANVVEIEIYSDTGSEITKYSETVDEPFYGRLHLLKLIQFKDNEKDIRVFRYMNIKDDNFSYNRLDFGGNDFYDYSLQELAANIKNIFVSVNNDSDIITLTVTMEGDENPIVLTKKISLRHKIKFNDSLLH